MLELDDSTAQREEERKDDATDTIIPWRGLGHTLHSLELWYLPKLVKLPKGMHHLTAHHFLDISYCSNFKELPEWIGFLSSLQSLLIQDSKSLKSLLEGLHYLSSLRILDLLECSRELKERSHNPTGVDWPIIQHITHIPSPHRSITDYILHLF